MKPFRAMSSAERILWNWWLLVGGLFLLDAISYFSPDTLGIVRSLSSLALPPQPLGIYWTMIKGAVFGVIVVAHLVWLVMRWPDDMGEKAKTLARSFAGNATNPLLYRVVRAFFIVVGCVSMPILTVISVLPDFSSISYVELKSSFAISCALSVLPLSMMIAILLPIGFIEFLQNILVR